jgi:hypothetical protein
MHALYSLALLTAVAGIGQIHIAFTPSLGVLSVDFVSDDGRYPRAWTSFDNLTWSAVAASTIHTPTIGYLHQATLNFSGAVRGAQAFYKVTTGGVAATPEAVPGLENSSPVFAVTPTVVRPEVFAIFGDLGDPGVITDDLTASAARGDFDAVMFVVAAERTSARKRSSSAHSNK